MNTSFYLERSAGEAVASLPPTDAVLWPCFTQYDRRIMRLVRDFSIGEEIVDICSIAAKVVVELNADGSGVESAGDRRRREQIRALGYDIMTVSAREIYANPSTVHDRLMTGMRQAFMAILAAQPEPAPSEPTQPDEAKPEPSEPTEPLEA